MEYKEKTQLLAAILQIMSLADDVQEKLGNAIDDGVFLPDAQGAQPDACKIFEQIVAKVENS